MLSWTNEWLPENIMATVVAIKYCPPVRMDKSIKTGNDSLSKLEKTHTIAVSLQCPITASQEAHLSHLRD
jgi:hypothetical protein